MLLHTTEGLNPGVEYREPDGFPSYLVGRDGSVMTCVVRGSKTGRKGPWRRLKTPKNKGYPVVNLCVGGKPTLFQVHVLVATVFHGPCPPDQQCRHLDGSRDNNHADNLCWGTQTENEADKLSHGRRPVGDRHGRHILTKGQVIQIKELLRYGLTHAAIAARFGVAATTISSISSGHSWTHVS